MRTLTIEGATHRANEHVKKAVAALPIEPSLTPRNQMADSMECRDPSDNGPQGRYDVSKRYHLDDIPKERNPEILQTLYKYWENNNYRILDDDQSRDDKFISVEHDGDAFGMSITESDAGDLTIGADSPCVWPDGVPPSTAE